MTELRQGFRRINQNTWAYRDRYVQRTVENNTQKWIVYNKYVHNECKDMLVMSQYLHQAIKAIDLFRDDS